MEGEAGEAEQETVATVPKASCIAIEYPGYIRNHQKAILTLGGEGSVQEAAEVDGAALKLRFRPDDPTSHPAFAEKQTTRHLLLRISRKAESSGSDGADGVRAEVAARIATTFRFTGMADFQYLPFDREQLTRSYDGLPPSNQPEVAEPSKTAHPFLLVPPLFSKVDIPLDYGFRQFKAAKPAPARERATDTAAAAAGGGGPPPSSQGGGRVVAFGAKSVPSAAPGGRDAAGGGAAAAQADASDAVAQRLAARPVWNADLLVETLLQQHAEEDVRRAMAQQTYAFRSGPWEGLCIRRGYDPRAKSNAVESGLYQAVTFSLPPEAHTRRISQDGGQAHHRMSDVLRFAALPSAAAVRLQLCDLTHNAAIRDALQGALSVADDAKCTEEHGWLAPAALSAVSAEVASRFGPLIDWLGSADGPGPSRRQDADSAAGAAATGAAGRSTAAAAMVSAQRARAADPGNLGALPASYLQSLMEQMSIQGATTGIAGFLTVEGSDDEFQILGEGSEDADEDEDAGCDDHNGSDGGEDGPRENLRQ